MSYTFKDDGASLTYYREYNKEVGTGDKTLVGNWVEERALRDVIKTGRYKLWVDPSSDGTVKQPTYTKFTTRVRPPPPPHESRPPPPLPLTDARARLPLS